MWQARRVAALLAGLGVECDIVQIETRGDDTLDRPLPEIGGDGVFTERIEGALRSSEIDIAVHSLKDLPVEDQGELCVGAVLGREEVREVLVSREGRKLAELPRGAVLGSSSTRRQAQVLSLRPDLLIRPIRGNVETRIRKVESGEYEATLLAGAGVIRLVRVYTPKMSHVHNAMTIGVGRNHDPTMPLSASRRTPTTTRSSFRML